MTIDSRLLSFEIAYASRVVFRLSRLSYVVFRLPCDLGFFSLYWYCLEVSCVSSIVLHACSLGCGLLFSLSFVWGLFLEFSLCVVRRVGTVGASALSLCCVLESVSFLLLHGLGKRVVICMFLERVVHIFCVFPFCSHVFLSGSTLRVAPAETRLTVYRRSNIFKMTCRVEI